MFRSVRFHWFTMKEYVAAFALTLFLTAAARSQLVNSEWNTGNGNWNVATNWFPNDVPDNGGGITYDVQIGNRPIANAAGVTFVPEDGTSDTILSLTMSNAADLFTNGNQLVVTGQTTIEGAGSTIRVDTHNTPGTVAFNTNNLDLNSGGGLTMRRCARRACVSRMSKIGKATAAMPAPIAAPAAMT